MTQPHSQEPIQRTDPSSTLRVPPPQAQPTSPIASSIHERNPTITFKHPGYADFAHQNVFLVLNAFDRNDRLALHYGTAHTACAIVSGNSWNGYFTLTREGERVALGTNDLLSEKSYYFHVPQSSPPQAPPSSLQPPLDHFKYPLCFSFEHWPFPHGNLPPAWSETTSVGHAISTEENRLVVAPPSSSTLTSAVLDRDGGCLMTGSRDCVESAHLCPRSQSSWFEKNGMGEYNINLSLSGDHVIDDISNAISFRPDIHTLFDNGSFVIVPKESRWVAHFCTLTNTIGSLYHNTPLDKPLNVSPELLLVRFAWTVFPFIRHFMNLGIDRSVKLLVKEKWTLKEIVENVRGGQLKERTRSESPKKRKAASGSVQDQVSTRTRRKRQRRYSSSALRSCRLPSDAAFNAQYTTTLTSATSAFSRSSASASNTFPAPQMDTSHPAADLSSPDSLSPLSVSLGQPNSSKLVSFKSMREEHLRRGRPSNPDLYCCDYRAAEAAAAAGLEGPKKFGGAHLCLKCLGVEYRDDTMKADEKHS